MSGALGKYKVEARLGGGGMAEVFVGSVVGAEGFARRVAIKRVLPGYSNNPTFAQMFVAERARRYFDALYLTTRGVLTFQVVHHALAIVVQRRATTLGGPPELQKAQALVHPVELAHIHLMKDLGCL